jgi:DNA-binding winged helix-turn-helix (wHTH) protein
MSQHNRNRPPDEKAPVTGCDGTITPDPAPGPPCGPEAEGLDPAHPYVNLSHIAEAARRVVREIRRFFPVAGKVWEFQDCPNPQGLRDAVGKRLWELECLLNPGRLPFDQCKRDPVDESRRLDPHRISGLPEGYRYVREELYETVANLVRRFDAVLEHYGLQDQINTHKDKVITKFDYEHMWWLWDLTDIEPKLLKGLRRAAELLQAVIDEDDCRLYLDLRWEETKAQPGGRAGAGENGGAGGQDGRPRPRPGFLGIALDEGSRTATRDGYRPLCLRGKSVLWAILKVLAQRGEQRATKPDLSREVWGDLKPDRGAPTANTIEANISRLRNLLRTVGLSIDGSPLVGYKLVPLPRSESN